MQKIRWFLLIVAIVLALALVFQNNDPVEFQILFLQQSLPLSLLLLSSTATGFLLGALMTALMLRKRKSKNTKPATKPSASKSPPSANPDANPLTS